MADEQQTYTYPETSGHDDYSKNATKGGTETIKSIVTNKRVMTLIAVLALMVFFMFRKPTKAAVKHVQEAPPVQKVDVPVVAPLIPPMPVMPHPPVQNAIPSDAMVQLMSTVSALENKLSDMETDQQSIQGRQDQLMQEINTISNKLEQKAQLAEKEKVKQMPVKVKKPEPQVHFSLQAVVEGRAWIVGNARTYTVVKGDKISTYGQVTAIHADEGYVETSSGRNIFFEQSAQ